MDTEIIMNELNVEGTTFLDPIRPNVINVKGEGKSGGNYVKVITPKIRSTSTYYINVTAEVTQ